MSTGPDERTEWPTARPDRRGKDLGENDQGGAVPGGTALGSDDRLARPESEAGHGTGGVRQTPRSRRVPQLYARPGRTMATQLGGDVAFVVWVLLWAFVGRLVKHLVDALSVPTEKLADAAAQVSDSSGTAGDKVHHVPGIGGTIAEPFQVLHDQVGSLSEAAHRQAHAIHHLAWGAGLVVFAIPLAVACWYWLPGRIRFIREANAARRLIDSDADLELFALRAMVHLPMRQLAAVSDDPVGDWRAGNQPVIDRLAALELKRQGLSMPRRRRPR